MHRIWIVAALLAAGCAQQPPSTVEHSDTRTEVNNTKVVKVPGDSKVVVVNRDVPRTTNVKVSAKLPAATPVTSLPSTKEPTSADSAATPMASEPSPSPVADASAEDTETSFALKGDQLTRSIDGKGRDIAVDGNNSHLTVSGEAGSLTVSGDGNVVDLENVKSVTVNGKNNQVHWTGTDPTVTDNGGSNQVAHR